MKKEIVLQKKTQEISNTKEPAEAREDTNDTQDRTSDEASKEPDVVLSDQGNDDEEGLTGTKEGANQEKSEEELDSEEEEEEEGEIEIVTPRMAKTKGRKSRK